MLDSARGGKGLVWVEFIRRSFGGLVGSKKSKIKREKRLSSVILFFSHQDAEVWYNM
jgi:hypothetical protein